MIVVAVSVVFRAGVGLLGEEEGHHHHGRERRQALQVSRGEERRGEERSFFIGDSLWKDETNEVWITLLQSVASDDQTL